MRTALFIIILFTQSIMIHFKIMPAFFAGLIGGVGWGFLIIDYRERRRN